MEPPPEILAAMAARARAAGPVSLKDQIWREAVGFHEAAQRNFEQRQGPDGRYAFPFTAGVAGLAFASELYLKELHLLVAGKSPKGHKLNVLFQNLPQATRVMIETRYNQRRQGSGAILARDLQQFANAFVEFRYVYEYGNRALDVVGLGHFASALYETCRRLDSGLQTFEYTHQRIICAMQGFPIFSLDNKFPPAPNWPDGHPL